MTPIPEFKAEDLARWSGGAWKGAPPVVLRGVVHDSRCVTPGSMYVALKGGRCDGHEFVPDAFRHGAAAALVSGDYRPAPTPRRGESGPLLKVADPLSAIRDLAAGYRRQWSGTVFGITGSVGKTTVKEMLASMLAVRGEVFRSPGNWNNHIGLPMSMLKCPSDGPAAVFELGMNRPGEIRMLSRTLRPDAALLTRIGPVHMAHFNSVEDIAEEKASLLAELAEGGWALLDADSRWFRRFRSLLRGRCVTWAERADADYRVRVGEGGITVNGHDFKIPVPGLHTAGNAARAAAAALEQGIDPHDIAEALARYRTAPMRWEMTDRGGVRLINDAYNANPVSMRAALSTLAGMADGGRCWAVLGGMSELGDMEGEQHRAIAEVAAELPLAEVITVGARARMIHDAGPGHWVHADTPEEAARLLCERVAPGDCVLFKGSRSERLETVLDRYRTLTE
ncbi:UDP-N-acetylmuramoyl-tripeptide--D-alanyl-D-alanine ligase [Kiritimatiella glycovorans]|uniref:UDP-N-acetylmuramoyl-tripeptide--D-alanyl-D-alanine ligase n=1 Tax=Kiritimatiella glycovorans TaxID=1307763 RepID=A0A0G3ELI2_9BACT|nr:UDP-N-acetylmuramoyl-tripeptide--D-alanyl-D-alanine ligase [Kiritimatiella glycovorans]AKJ64999.1 UDP-N-acetylmuramoyl-tripeptide--D-alanyl-D-alanine ligase [Kiritimatiella glycovorans]